MRFEVQPDANLQGERKKGHYLDERIEVSRCDDWEYEYLGGITPQCEKVEVQVFDLKDSLCSYCKNKECHIIKFDEQPEKSSTLKKMFGRSKN